MSRVVKDAKIDLIQDEYDIGKILGKGGFSVVKEGVHKSTGNKVAIKIVSKNQPIKQLKLLAAEVDILNILKGNPRIVNLYDVFEDNKNIYLVLELITGGELFDKIAEQVYYSEQDGSKIIRAILEALLWCHERNVVHRDLKPENLLCGPDFSTDYLTDLKLSDFGIAYKLNDNEKLNVDIGTRMYQAPEVILKQPYALEVDMWAMGVISYILLGGYPPFTKDNDYGLTLNDQIVQGKFAFHDEEWKEVGDKARDFISHLLKVDAKERLTCAQALEHPFIKDHRQLNMSSMGRSLDALRQFNAKRKFKNVAHAIMSSNRLQKLLFKKTQPETETNEEHIEQHHDEELHRQNTEVEMSEPIPTPDFLKILSTQQLSEFILHLESKFPDIMKPEIELFKSSFKQ